MIKILTYNEIDCAEWSRLVQTSATGTWFQTPEAYEFFSTQKDIMKPFVVGVASLPSLQGRDGERLNLRAVCVGYVTLEKNDIRQYFTRRAIVTGGPCLAEDATDEEVTALLEAVKEKASLQLSPVGKKANAQNTSTTGCFKGCLCSLFSGRDGGGLRPIYLETRNFNDYSKWRNAFEHCGDHLRRSALFPFRWKDTPGFEYKKHLNFHVDCRDKDKIWERLSDNRKRQVRHARNNGATVTLSKDEKDIREWYKILHQLYVTRVKTPLFPLEFFIEANSQGVGKFLIVKHEGKVIGGSMIVTHERGNEPESESESEGERGNGGTVYEWFECGLNSEYKELYPSVMATYAGIEYAAEHGYARYDMMGAGEPGVPYGVRDFKSEFGGEMVEQGRFLCICKSFLYKLGTIGVKILRKS